jgi:hypothetical protein
MKAIDLLTHETYSVKLDPKALGYIDADDLTVDFSIRRMSHMAKIEAINPANGEKIGEIDITKVQQDLVQARKNGGNIIYTTIVIEQKLNEIISKYLFGNDMPNSKRDFFVKNILCTSHIGLAAKKALVFEILDAQEFFEKSVSVNDEQKSSANQKKGEFDKLLKNVMTYRNAFAHGELKHESPTGCILYYHSGRHQSMMLDDEFWTKIEKEYEEVLEYLNKMLAVGCQSNQT